MIFSIVINNGIISRFVSNSSKYGALFSTFQAPHPESLDLLMEFGKLNNASPALPSLAGPLGGDLEAVRVHGGHDVDARVVEQPPDVVVRLVVVHQVQDQVQHQLPAQR